MALILLDAGLVGLAISKINGRRPENDSEVLAFQDWVAATDGVIHEFAISDVTRYEVLRGLYAKGSADKLDRFHEFAEGTIALTVVPATWERAARLWADVRRRGRPTAHEHSLDGDAILAALAVDLAEEGHPVVVATTNVRHLLALGTKAQAWRDIYEGGHE